MNEKNAPKHKKSGQLMLYIAWIIALGLLTVYFKPYEQAQYNPNFAPTTIKNQQGSNEVALQRNHYGQYISAGKINHHKVTFLIDTGASEVSIPENIAERLALEMGAGMLRGTANGTIKVYATRLKQLDIGGISLHNVRASINPHMDGETILLGMSALKEIEFRQQGKVLTLVQAPNSP